MTEIWTDTPKVSLKELAEQQGIKPITIEEWAQLNPFSSWEEVQEFIAWNREARREAVFD